MRTSAWVGAISAGLAVLMLGCEASRTSRLPLKGRSTGQTAASPQPPDRHPPQPVDAAPQRTIREAQIVHGVGAADDGVLLGVYFDSVNQYKTVFGGTQGGINPPGSLSQIYILDKWVYVHGKFTDSSTIMRWPIVITQTIGIGADGTTFIVQRDNATDNSPQAVYCLEGTVTVYNIKTGAAIATLKTGEFLTTTCGTTASGQCNLMASVPATIPTAASDPHRQFVDGVNALARKFAADVLYP